MKPKDLKHPFSWEDRRVLLKDRVWYFPEYLIQEQDFVFPGWEHLEMFGNSNPVHVEYCSGNGAWIAEKAKQNPDINWVAVEIRFDRVRKIWSKMKNENLDNLLIACGEGIGLTERYFPEKSLARAYINFPDPWPKDRHAKHRIVNPKFVSEMRRVMADDGVVTLVTDDPDYSDIMIEAFSEFRSLHPEPYYATHLEGYGSSYFDSLWREKGKTIRYHQFVKGEN